MKEKLKALGMFLLQWAVILFIPFAAIGAVIYYLYMKLTTKNQQLAQKEVENELLDSLAKRDQAKREADDSVANYEKIKELYLKENKDE